MAAAKKTNKVKEPTSYFKKLVTVTLLKDNNNYKDDVTITYNGTNYQIKRGIPVQVPMYIKLILEDACRQQMVADAYSEKLKDNFVDKTNKMGN